MGQVSLEEILITDELSRRLDPQMSSLLRSPNLQAENEALRTLARQLIEQPQTMLKSLVTIAKDLCQAGTAGVSLLEKTDSGEEIFRWVVIAGELEQYEQGTIPRQLSPCSLCLDRQSPQLYSYPARYFTDFSSIEPPIVEALIIPLMAANQQLGAIWIVSHDPQRQFDAEDARIMSSLADFTAAALYNNQTRQAAESAQSLLHLLLEHVPEGITIAGGPPDFPLIANSKLAQEWLGKSDESLIGMSSGDHVQSYGLFLPDGVARPTPEQLPLYRATRNDETIRDEECIIERPDGTRIAVSANVVPVRNSQGEIIGAVNCWRNITEQKQIEAALRQSEAELSLITNTVPVLISFVDAEQRYRFNNRTYEEWFGHPAADVYGKPIREVLGETAYETIRSYVEQALAGQQVTFESQVPYQNGGTRYVIATYIPRFNSQGVVEGFVGLVSDISQRKQAELALRQSEERLRFAQRAAKAGVWDWNLLNNQVTWSEEYYHLYGLDPATIQPSYENWLASIAQFDRERVDRITRETLAHQRNLNVEFRVSHPTQGERWITAIGQTFYDANQQPTRMSGIALDITDRKQAEEALRESEARFRHMADTAPVLIWMSGPDRLCNYFNQPWLDFTGRTLEQELGNGWAEGIHPDDLQRCLNTYVTAFDARQPFQMEYRLRRFDGMYRWIIDEAVPRFTADKDFLGYIGSCIDIEDRKQAELEREQLLVRERHYIDQLQGLTTAALSVNSAVSVEQVLRVITDQAALIIGAHQSVTSITIDQNWAQGISAIYLSDKYAQWREYSEKPDGSGIYACVCDLNRPIRMTQAELEAHPHWQGFGKAADKHPPMRGWLAAPLMGRDGQNIGLIQLSDKYEGDFTETDEAILVQLPHSPLPIPHYAQIRVTDTGQGIDPEFLPYMFDYFRQADSATTRKFGGLGLGLAIARHIVELHGGVIAAASPGEGQGATFVVRLPLSPHRSRRQEDANRPDAASIAAADQTTRELASSQPSPHSSSLPLNGLHILLVDDDTDTRNFGTFVLEQGGAKVTAVESAVEAIQALTTLKLDVLISDIGMPDVDGYMLLRQLRKLEAQRGGNLPAIALTAYAGETNQQKALASGFQYHLSKPVEPDALVQTIVALVKPSE